jgi:hypothetical protein
VGTCIDFQPKKEFDMTNDSTKVARIGRQMPAADPLPPSIWRDQLKQLGYWALMAAIGLTVWPTLAYLALRA